LSTPSDFFCLSTGNWFKVGVNLLLDVTVTADDVVLDMIERIPCRRKDGTVACGDDEMGELESAFHFAPPLIRLAFLRAEGEEEIPSRIKSRRVE
jgi:hypothetical protein